jgi:DNA-binding transcriptional regulator YiaG
LTLGVHLPIKFRLSGGTPLRYSARAFLRIAGIVEDEYTAYEQLERVEKSLMYMVEHGYLGSFETERFKFHRPEREPGEEPQQRRPRARMIMKPRKSSFEVDLLDESWTVEAPLFLRALIEKTAAESAALEQAAKSEAANPAFEQPNLPGMDLIGPPPHEGQLLRIVRKKLGMSQGELAAALDVTQAAVSMAESGKRPNMAERLFQRARRLIPKIDRPEDALSDDFPE